MRFRLAVLLVMLGFAFTIAPQADAQSVQRLGMADSSPSAMIPLDDRAFHVVDDFEDGNINGWIADGTHDCSISLSEDNPFGSYCMRIDGACFPFNGYYLNVGNEAPVGVHLYVRSATTTTSDTFFVLGDEFHEVVYFSGGPGVWRVYDGAPHSCGPRIPNQWYYIHFDIDWACKMYDVYINGMPKMANANFYDDTVSGINRIHVFNLDNTTAYYDEIVFETQDEGPLIFADDFKRGSVCRWSNVVD